ncbi:MAG: hypothetical protein ACK559_27350, partial [bacterium]
EVAAGVAAGVAAAVEQVEAAVEGLQVAAAELTLQRVQPAVEGVELAAAVPRGPHGRVGEVFAAGVFDEGGRRGDLQQVLHGQGEHLVDRELALLGADVEGDLAILHAEGAADGEGRGAHELLDLVGLGRREELHVDGGSLLAHDKGGALAGLEVLELVGERVAGHVHLLCARLLASVPPLVHRNASPVAQRDRRGPGRPAAGPRVAECGLRRERGCAAGP